VKQTLNHLAGKYTTHFVKGMPPWKLIE